MSERYKIGFTGTQDGMTDKQKENFIEILTWYFNNFPQGLEFHQGNCIGADEEALRIVQHIDGIWTVAHPPTETRRQHSLLCDETREPKWFLDRDHDIVDEVNVLLAAPRSRKEELRSGTWATVRYARKKQRPLEMVWPN